MTRWLREGAQPKSVVAFTFTEKAASELKARVHRHVVEEMGQQQLGQLGPMYVGTIHGYCLRLLQEHGKELANYEILDEHRQVALLFREYKRLRIAEGLGAAATGRTFSDIHAFVRNVDVVYNELIAPAGIKGKRGLPFRLCLERFEETLRHYRVMNYGQIVAYAVDRLSRDKQLRASVHKNLRFLVVDEYQDVNPAQEALIRMLVEAPANITVVGDDDQAIYQWRGSEVENLVGFAKRYKATTHRLLDNHRSRPHIVKRANAVASGIRGRLDKAMNPIRDELPPSVHVWEAETSEAEAQAIAASVSSLLERGFKGSEVAVLCRSVRTSGEPIMRSLQAAGIPFQTTGRTGLFEQPEVAFLFKSYAFLADAEWRPSRYDEGVKIDETSLERQFQMTRFGKMGTFRQALGWLRAKRSDIHAGAKFDLLGDYYSFLKTIGTSRLDGRDSADGNTLHYCARFSQILADFEHMTRRARPVSEEEQAERAAAGKEQLGGEPALRFVAALFFHQRLASYIQWYGSESYEDDEGDHSRDENAVQVMTIHQAKGLEFPVVFVPAVVGRRFPSKYAGANQEWALPEKIFDLQKRQRYEGSENDERRLFYVAVTRARDLLCVSRFRRTAKRRTSESPFFSEMLAGGKPLDVGSGPLPLPDIKPVAKAPEPGVEEVSVTELLVYETCPYAFKLRNKLSFQPPLARELGYGKLVHHLIHQLSLEALAKKKVPSSKMVEDLLERQFYLPFANRAAYAQMRESVRRYLDNFLAGYGEELFNVREAERRFELPLTDARIVGRADVILDEASGPNAVALVDYKTGLDSEDAPTMDAYKLQLRLYAAAGRAEGLDTKAAYLHDLKANLRHKVEVGPDVEKVAVARFTDLAHQITKGCFDPKPDRRCQDCDVRAICKHSKARD